MRTVLMIVLASALLASGCSGSVSPAGPSAFQSSSLATSPRGEVLFAAGVVPQASRNDHACWGEATQVFARMGEMGIHASQQETPRLGLRNVARLLYELGLIPDDSLQALGAFLSSILGLSIDSCL